MVIVKNQLSKLPVVGSQLVQWVSPTQRWIWFCRDISWRGLTLHCFVNSSFLNEFKLLHGVITKMNFYQISQSFGKICFLAVVLSLYFLTQSHAEVLSRSFGFSKSAGSNIALKNHLLWSLKRVRSPARCLANCLREPQCVAVNYKDLSGICELIDGTKTEYPGDLKEESGWMYYEAETKVRLIISLLFIYLF